ncbi:Bromodomain-containing protein [Aureobasidium pullulans]|uniref:Bromodomain-containing protein n=1 Tax=Aureobasidium pullulans TaxID=5580 RepID=A0A4S9X984_AURPU|nr:Bromodomain-containing protein [Aureobasidium pullulans]
MKQLRRTPSQPSAHYRKKAASIEQCNPELRDNRDTKIMDRSRKRKAAAGASPDVDTSTPKRQKTTLEHETPQTTTKIGLQFIDHLKSAKDKTGRLIADLFIDLPSKRELPDYYRTIKLPIAIQTVQDKLERHEYPTLSTVESDIKRMVSNAKQYNDDKSTVYQDAERIRKALSNFMTKHNPAYKDPNYVALPTPLPGQDDDATASSAPPTRDPSEQPRKIKISLKANRDRKIAIFEPFVHLPPRTLTDYYKVIKKPTSLAGIKKQVRGKQGSDFKNWDAFEDEVSYIWRNARIYNEDGSDIFNLSVELEDLFNERLATAKSQVDEPVQPKIKLNAPRPKPVLHLGARGSPAPRGTPAEDKKEEPVTNGHKTPVPAQARPASSAAPSRSNSQVPTTVKATSVNASSPVPTTAAAVKTETTVAASPSLAAVRPQSIAPEVKQSPRPGTATSMPPPPSVRAISGSPHPSMLPHVPHVPQYVPPPPTFVDKYTRSKPLSEALLPSVVIMTHPQLTVPKPFRLEVPANKQFTQQSLSTAVPAAHYYISIVPNVSQRLLMQRQYKTFVTVNGVRLMGTTRDFLPGGGDRKQVYDTALIAGVNRIEVEVVAVSGKTGALEVEKLSVFASLLK